MRIEQMIDGDAPLNDILAEPPGRPKLKTAMVLSGM